MARIRSISAAERSTGSPHPTEVDAEYLVISGPTEGSTFLQLDTFGSDGRQSERKVSQTFQLDAKAAMELRKILDVVFPRN